jgi:ferredoxin
MVAGNSEDRLTSTTEKSEIVPVHVNGKTFERIEKARKEGEALPDVIARLSQIKVTALQQRGERGKMTSDNRRLLVRIDQPKCAGAESCVTVAPSIFALDVRQLGWGRRGSEPLGVKNVAEGTVDSETISIAAHSCPYRAIYVKDTNTGEEIAGYP